MASRRIITEFSHYPRAGLLSRQPPPSNLLLGVRARAGDAALSEKARALYAQAASLMQQAVDAEQAPKRAKRN